MESGWVASWRCREASCLISRWVFMAAFLVPCSSASSFVAGLREVLSDGSFSLFATRMGLYASRVPSSPPSLVADPSSNVEPDISNGPCVSSILLLAELVPPTGSPILEVAASALELESSNALYASRASVWSLSSEDASAASLLARALLEIIDASSRWPRNNVALALDFLTS